MMSSAFNMQSHNIESTQSNVRLLGMQPQNATGFGRIASPMKTVDLNKANRTFSASSRALGKKKSNQLDDAAKISTLKETYNQIAIF